MSWHYQLMRHRDKSLAVHEYYISEDGSIQWTKNPISIVGDDIEEVKESIQMILNDIDRHGVKDYEE